MNVLISLLKTYVSSVLESLFERLPIHARVPSLCAANMPCRFVESVLTTSSASPKTGRATLTANLSRQRGMSGKSYFRLIKSIFNLKRLRCVSAYMWARHV